MIGTPLILLFQKPKATGGGGGTTPTPTNPFAGLVTVLDAETDLPGFWDIDPHLTTLSK